MNKDDSTASTRRIVGTAAISLTLLWIAQPPMALWPVAMFAIVPMLALIATPNPISRRGYLLIWATSTVYWLFSLQGLRHAHPAMHFPWLALGGYLAIYHVVFISVTRRIVQQGIPLIVAAPVTWVAQECIRNYAITGISALMLGHTVADVPGLIQIADLAGSYGIGFVIVTINVAVYLLLVLCRRECSLRQIAASCVTAAMMVAATLGYGYYRLHQPLGDEVATFALIQRNEHVEYGQPVEHEITIFQNYVKETVDALRASQRPVDAVVWPESMFTGGVPWMIAQPTAKAPPEARLSGPEFQAAVAEQRRYYLERTGYVLDALAAENSPVGRPHLLVGCGVIHYRDEPHVFSGVISIDPDGTVQDWYGKTHLVMFGEYIPIAPWIPGLRNFIPPGMGLKQGPGAKLFQVGETTVAPNICIETSVERVTVNQLNSLRRGGELPEVIVTVTNDGWFDDSSVIEHHLRCGQLVAVACRRPLLSAANNGPTAWINSRGGVDSRLPRGNNGAVVATPRRDDRTSLYVVIGDWPARFCVLFCGVVLVRSWLKNRRKVNDDLTAAKV